MACLQQVSESNGLERAAALHIDLDVVPSP